MRKEICALSITLTAKQEWGLREAVERYKNGEKYTVISGYAGSGKSTLVKFIIDALDVNPEEEVAYVAFTGKAAAVLAQKGCPNATTAHKLLYKAKPMPNGTYKFIPKDTLDGIKIVVVDEVSMLSKALWNQLLSHPVYVIALGDPFQLPPINPDDDNHVLDHPHVFLYEIMRQAQDSEIIRLSMWIREGKSLAAYPCQREQVQVLSKNDVVTGMYDWADQILCATNKQRVDINREVRKLRGFGEEPCIGDKIISLRNHWEDASATGNWALTNGSIGTIEYINKETMWFPKYIYDKNNLDYMFTNIGLEDGDSFEYVPIDYQALVTGKPTLTPQEAYKMNKNKNYLNAPYEFAYAYAITCHKAQGSQWPKVAIFEESFPTAEEEHARWLYTAITRASEKVLIIKK